MNDVRLHETVSVSGQAESAREALATRVPPLAKAYEQMVYLGSLHAVLSVLLAGEIRQNPYFYAGPTKSTPGLDALRRTRTQLGRLCLDHAETLGSGDDANRMPGWNRLMLIWVVMAQLSACLERLGQQRRTCDTLAFLARNELLTTPNGIDDVPDMSMREVRRANDLLRDRLFMLDRPEPALFHYISALELRAGEFACGLVAEAANFDVPTWRAVDTASNGRCVVTRAFLATMAWHFVWVRRHVWAATQTGFPHFYTSEVRGSGIVTPWRVSPEGSYGERRAALGAFVLKMAESMDTEDHQREFTLIGSPYNVAPGDLDAHSHVYGMSGVERATVRDAVAMRRCPSATTYLARDKWKTSRLVDWIRSGLARARLNGDGRMAGGGAACEAFLEQLAVIHTINSFFQSRLQVQWTLWFVITHRAAGRDLPVRVAQAVRNGLPFIVQRLGKWLCCVPRPRGPRAMFAAEARVDLFGPDDEEMSGDINWGCRVYECPDVLAAIVVWATYLDCGWEGRIHHSGRALRPAIRVMLGLS